MANYRYCSYEIDNNIGTLEINRPPVNALEHRLLSEIHQVAKEVARDASKYKLRVLLIQAKGKHFCAGADLKERIATPADKVAGVLHHLSAAIRSIGDLAIPVIALVHGSTLGGGFELALTADIRVFADSAKVALRETALAIIPGAGGTQRLSRLIGYSKALYWITSGHIFSAKEAHEQGVADYLVPETELRQTGMKLAEEIAANGPFAVQQAKKAIRAGLDLPLDKGLDKEFSLYLPLIPTQDRREGLYAFFEKRKPKYTGQ
ncbi:enoyl-CoA hydratase/isomerase family protein [Planctomycetota bacterium]